MYAAKYWVSALGAVLIAIIPVLPPGTDDLKQWLTVAVAVCTSFGVYLVPNAEPGRHVAGRDPQEVVALYDEHLFGKGVSGLSANGAVITGNEYPPKGLE